MTELILPKESQESLINGASMFIIPVDNIYQDKIPNYAKEVELLLFAQMVAPYYLEDEVYIKEKLNYQSLDMVYCDNTELNRHIASELGYTIGLCKSGLIGFHIRDNRIIGLDGLSYLCNDLYLFNAPYNHNSEYKRINLIKFNKKVKNVKVVKVKNIPIDDKDKCFSWKISDIMGYHMSHTWVDWYNNQYGNYEDNPYVFLYEVEVI